MWSEVMKEIIIREDTSDFKEGFNFAVKAIHDMIQGREDYTLEKLNETLTTIITLIDNGVWWPGIKKVIIQ
jgi:hypothetical protein